MTVRTHLFPFRTQKLSSLVPKIVRWKRRVKIGSRRLLYGPLVKRLRQRPLTPLTSVRIRYGSPRRSKLHIVRFRLKPKAYSFRCFSFTVRNRFAGLLTGEKSA